MKKRNVDQSVTMEVRPEYSLTPDDDLYGSPRSWTGFRTPVGEPDKAPPRSGRFFLKLRKKRPYQGGFKSVSQEKDTHPKGQRSFAQAIGALALFFAVWMLFQSDRPVATAIQGDIRSLMTTDDSAIVLPPALARDFGVIPSSALTTLSAHPAELTLLQPLTGTVTRAFSVVTPDVVIKGRPGSRVDAATEGLVVRVGESQANGHYVLIDHGSAGQTFYAQLGSVYVRPQEYVVAGQMIGALPGDKTELTFGYTVNGSYRNPQPFFSKVK